MLYPRQINLSTNASSLFLFGPRMTGKTYLLQNLKADDSIDLLEHDLELTYRSSPEIFWERISALAPQSLIIIDEIQKIPELLNYVQKAIEKFQHRFILSGSSSRKLKRSGANLLGGRAIELKLYPLSSLEIGDSFAIELVMSFGSLPKVYSLAQSGQIEDAKDLLYSYYGLYIREEVQAEALTRNISAFQRFLNIAAQAHGHVIEYANIAKYSKVPDSTVKEYFSILEDTLIGAFLWPWDASERKKARPKFYFFDPGVVRAIQNRLNDPPTGQELGYLFEGWFVYEVIRINHYFKKRLTLGFWRDGDHEIDVLIYNHKLEGLAVEVKSGEIEDLSEPLLTKFRSKFPKIQIVIASMKDKVARKLPSGVLVLPQQQVLEMIRNL